MSRVTEDQFLGALLGTAIGDALGLPVEGLSASEILDKYGAFDGYLEIDDAGDGQPISGIISDKTEVALCIVESLTTNDGFLDPENINARLGFLLRGTSRRWLSDEAVRGIELAADRGGLIPADLVSAPEAAVALRGVPVGMLHAIGGWDEESLRKDAATVTRLTHGGEESIDLTARVASATAIAARSAQGEEPSSIRFPDNDDPLAKRVERAIESVGAAETFEGAVLPVVREGGESSALGAIAGGIAGARFGASGIPQYLIDELDARIYLSMAAPWFFRTVLRRAGTVIDLRLDTNEFPEIR
ncbi:MAG TPA: ADP-ribosylglycohydrolase family protein [Thermomicrobiales bacterium]|nr:ADP-ribosylglycohydrolase family protein [Thermomicrobiales bacterium]